MNISNTLRSRVEIVNEEYYKRYMEIVSIDDTDNYTEKHHILPKRLFPEYISFRDNPWNMVRLNVRNHIMAHYYFSMATNTLWNAIPMVSYMGKDFDPDNIEAISIAMTTYKMNYIGENHHRFGMKHTEETKKKMSESKIGHKVTEETRQKISVVRKGMNLSSEWVENIRKGCKGCQVGKAVSEETKIKQSEIKSGENNPMYGRNHTEETRRKMKESNKKAQRKGEIWNELYNELYDLWIGSGGIETGYKFAKWLRENTHHQYGNSALNKLVIEFLSLPEHQ